MNGRVINIVTTERDSVFHATDIYPEIFGTNKVDVDNVPDLDEINQKSRFEECENTVSNPKSWSSAASWTR